MSANDRPTLRLATDEATVDPTPARVVAARSLLHPDAAKAVAWQHVVAGYEDALRVAGLAEDERRFLLKQHRRCGIIAGCGARLALADGGDA
jgi:hypothetical protein